MTSITVDLSTVKPAYWLAPIQAELLLLEQKMLQSSHMGHDVLDAAVSMIVQAGGKRLRPAVTILVGQMLGVPVEPILSVAASVELLHTATLIHDDMIDGAAERRGVPTLHNNLSTGVTVLTGDFLFAQSAALAAEANNVEVVRLFAETLVRICKGEILQAQTRWQIPSFEVYIERIYGKTAALFEAAARAAALLSNINTDGAAALTRYGRSLGLAFQVVDDALDFISTAQRLGKPAGHDLRQGIFNLPVMYFVEKGYMTPGELIKNIESSRDLHKLVEDMRRACVIEQSLDVARRYAQQAEQELDRLPDSIYTDSLRALTRYAISREH